MIIAQLFQYPSFRLVWPQSTKMQGGLQCSLDGKTIGTIPTFILPCEAFISSCNVVLKDNPDPVSPPNNWGVDIVTPSPCNNLIFCDINITFSCQLPHTINLPHCILYLTTRGYEKPIIDTLLTLLFRVFYHQTTS